MPDLPVMLNIHGRRVVIVGGGSVAKRRAMALIDAGAMVEVIAPDVDPALASLNLTVHSRTYQGGDLADAMMVVVATDNSEVNQIVTEDARQSGVLVNRADQPELGDVVVPAHKHHGPVTVSVYTNGMSPRAAAVMRDQMIRSLDDDWLPFLEAVAPLRSRLINEVEDATVRRNVLLKLTNEDALAAFKTAGIEGVESLYDRLVSGEPSSI